MAYGAAVGPWPVNYGAVFTSRYSNLPPASSKQRAVQYAAGRFGQRQFARPIEFDIEREISGAPPTTLRISFFSQSGGLLGRIHTDAPLHVLIDCEINFGPGQDCRNAILEMASPPVFEIPRFSKIEIKVGDNIIPWFSGRLTEIPEPGSSPEQMTSGTYVYEATGFSDDFNNLNAEGTYDQGLDVGQVVYDIIESKAGRSGTFSFNPGKIDTATGTLLQFDIDVSRANLSSVLDIFASWSGAIWGCDGTGDFFFRSKQDYIAEILFIQNSGGFTARSDSKIANSIIVKKQAARGSGKSGTETIAILNDLTSQAKYPIIEKTITLTGDYSDEDAEVIGNRILAENSEPRVNASASGIRIKDGFSKLSVGLHRWVSPFGAYEVTAQECDDLTSISVNGDGDAVVSIDDEILHDGAGSCRIDFMEAAGQHVVFGLDPVRGKIRSLTVWIRSTIGGSFLEFGIGNSSWDEHVFKASVGNIIGRFYPIVIDLGGIEIDAPAKFGIKILDNQAAPSTVHVDTIKMKALDYRYFDLRPNRERYIFSPERGEISVDYSEIPPRLEDFIAGLERARKELQFVTEER